SRLSRAQGGRGSIRHGQSGPGLRAGCAAPRRNASMQALGLVWGDVDTPSYEPDEQSMPLAAPVHFGARLLFEYWEERAAHGGIAIGRDVPPRKLSPILLNPAVYEPLEGDFRIRLAGAAFLRRF